MKFLTEFVGEGIWQFAIFPMIILGYGALCFVIFDYFHITDLGAQILIALSPFLLLAYVLWKRESRWGEHETPTTKEDTVKRIIQEKRAASTCSALFYSSSSSVRIAVRATPKLKPRRCKNASIFCSRSRPSYFSNERNLPRKAASAFSFS